MACDKKFLVVCEGPSDFPIIEGIIQHVGKINGKTFEVLPLSPQIDATTGKADPHGWTEVKRWCLNYKLKSETELLHLSENIRKMALRKNWEALLALSKADYLLIHMDTDIAEQIDGSFDSSVQTRRNYCEINLNLWLGLTFAKPNCRYVLPTYSIETWILGTYDSTDTPTIFPLEISDYETLSDVEAKLLTIGYARKSTGKLKKSHNRYKNNDRYLPRLIRNISKSVNKCNELKTFTRFIQGL